MLWSKNIKLWLSILIMVYLSLAFKTNQGAFRSIIFYFLSLIIRCMTSEISLDFFVLLYSIWQTGQRIDYLLGVDREIEFQKLFNKDNVF